MTDFNHTLIHLEDLLLEQVERLRSLVAENQKLKNNIDGMQDEIKSQKNIIKDLEEKNKLVKIAETISENKADQTVLKKTIEKYITEIDRCIALVNASDN
ncbi:MAG: hypothetical protein ACI8ZN_000999 [Bacteroidia bacterium]|jgi:CHASE3 domain sensor protein